MRFPSAHAVPSSGEVFGTMKNLRWGIIGTGAIAKAFARGLQHARHGRLQAVASRAPATARDFANEFGIARAYGSYDGLLADSEVDAIYIALGGSDAVNFFTQYAAAGGKAKRQGNIRT